MLPARVVWTVVPSGREVEVVSAYASKAGSSLNKAQRPTHKQ